MATSDPASPPPVRREATVRALIAGCGIGALFAAGNVYTGLKTGFIDGLAIPAALIAFMLFSGARRLGARSFGTLMRVILPMLRPAIVTAMVYSFVRAVTAVSAVIFLVTGRYNLATVYIVGRADVGDYGVAIVYSAMLVIVMLSVLLLIQLLVGERRIGRRAAAPAVDADIALART